MNIKQVLVYRRDLNMRKGKIAAQCAHASMKVFFDRSLDPLVTLTPNDHPSPLVISLFQFQLRRVALWLLRRIYGQVLVIPLDDAMWDWVTGLFGKVVLSVENEDDLLRAYEAAKAQGLPAALITDAGRTEFHGQPTHTCIAIGPASAEAIDRITGPEGLVTTKLA